MAKNKKVDLLLRQLLVETFLDHDVHTYAVIHLLLASYSKGTQKDFAEWCCKYSGLRMESLINGEPVPDYDGGASPPEWVM